MTVPERFTFKLEAANSAEESSGGGVGRIFVLDSASRALIFEHGADVSHCGMEEIIRIAQRSSFYSEEQERSLMLVGVQFHASWSQ